MTKYLGDSFSVFPGGSKAYRDNFDNIFKKDKPIEESKIEPRDAKIAPEELLNTKIGAINISGNGSTQVNVDSYGSSQINSQDIKVYQDLIKEVAKDPQFEQISFPSKKDKLKNEKTSKAKAKKNA